MSDLPSTCGTVTRSSERLDVYEASMVRQMGLTASSMTSLRRLVARTAIIMASKMAEPPSYTEALAQSMSSRRHTAVWYSKMACRVPCEASGW